jgi:uncharacterized iron-regulated membrane protein
MTFRKSVFWLHLTAGLIAGLVIAVMSFTGAAIAFRGEILNYAERDVMQVAPPAPNAPHLPLAALVRAAQEAKPGSRPMSVLVSSDPTQVVQVAFGRDGTLYVNPYTGEVHEPSATRWRAFLQTMESWHRFLGRSGTQRAAGKAVADACNAAFLFLALSGLFLWWPRKWRTKGLRRSLVFLRDATGRARDWNWHNVIGFWSALVLIVLTATGVVMSYRWANDLVYKASGSPVPGQQSPASPAPAKAQLVITAPKPAASADVSAKLNPPALDAPKDGAAPMSYDALIAAVQKLSPDWETLTLRLGGNPGDGRGPRPAGATASGATASGDTHPREAQGRVAPPPVIMALKEPATSPRFSLTTLMLNPMTGELMRRDTFADNTLGRRVRSWIRFLHTGEAFGPVGEFIAALACLGACFLVYTGFALAWRRFFMKKEEKPAPVIT